MDALLQGEDSFFNRIGEALGIDELALESAIAASMAAGATTAPSRPSTEPVAGDQ